MIIQTEPDMKSLGRSIGQILRGGECIELIGDLGAGKTTFTKGIGAGLEIDDDVQSPSFTIMRVYAARNGLLLHHYDFYRLQEPGVMSFELAESLEDPKVITIVEWGETIKDVLPGNRIKMLINYMPEAEGREVKLHVPAEFLYLKDIL